MTKKKLTIYVAIFLGLFAVAMCHSCRTSGEDEKTDDSQDNTTLVEEKDEKPKQVNVVIDKSASMKGYFSAGNMRPLLETIVDIVNSGTNEGTVRFFGDDVIENYAKSLKYASGFDKDTDMKPIIDSLLKEAGRTPVAFITDGIISSEDGMGGVPAMIGAIKRLLEKNDSVATIIYRVESPYNGEYWVEKSRLNSKYYSESISIEARPFYVILMGPKENIRYFNKNCPIKMNNESMSFNSHDNHENLEMYSSDDNVFSKGNGNEYVKKDTRESYELGFAFPPCLKDRVEKVGPNNASLVLNGDTLKRWNVKLQSGSDNIALLTISNKGANDSQPFDEIADALGSCILELKFDTPDITEWYRYHSDDDSKIAANIDEQSKTFGLKDLIEPFYEAQKNKYVKVTFKFTN